jgi:hypothetical protein
MARPPLRAIKKSGGEFGAALGAAIGKDLAAANSCHAGAKTMPALADEFGRLIGPFHDSHSTIKTNRKDK